MTRHHNPASGGPRAAIRLKGIAWNHTRGFVPVVATAQRYEELHPEVSITWEKRSLQAFADASLEDLASAHDLIVMDHPHAAQAARAGILVPLDTVLPREFVADQAANSVGRSHASYAADGHQWSLATDAAAPVATWRPDLVRLHGIVIPTTWEDVMDLAVSGFVTVSLYPLDALMHLYTFCDALGEPAFSRADCLAGESVVGEALHILKALADACDPACLGRNPIRTAEFMSQSRERAAAYCPFAYGYSNYSRPAYACCPLKAGNAVSFHGRPLRTCLGGAGLAISARTRHPQTCADYARFTASPEIQKGIYFESGGQPGHRAAWVDEAVNLRSGSFFRDTLETLDNALLRPRYPGYMYFQDSATPVMQSWLGGASTAGKTIHLLNSLYLESLDK